LILRDEEGGYAGDGHGKLAVDRVGLIAPLAVGKLAVDPVFFDVFPVGDRAW